jgi:hypothetical protein
MLKWAHSNVNFCKSLLINYFTVLASAIVFPEFFLTPCFTVRNGVFRLSKTSDFISPGKPGETKAEIRTGLRLCWTGHYR